MGTNNNTPNTPNTLNQYTQSAGETLTYDGNGNLTGDGTNTYTYDAANQITAANGDTYAYDPFGRRRTKTVDSTTTTYIYAGDQAIAEYGASGLEKKFVYGPGIDEPIFMNANSATHYYHADALGSVIALTDGAGAVAETYQYTAFGQVDAASALGNPYLYTGRRLDEETGLYYYRARYYDAGLRRFLQTDPIGYDGGMNLYAYLGNSPLSLVDPYGENAALFFIEGVKDVALMVGFTALALWYIEYGQPSLQNVLSRDDSDSGGNGNNFCPISLGESSPATPPGDPNDPDDPYYVSKRNRKHIGKHVGKFKTYDSSWNVDKSIKLGHQIASNQNNLVSARGVANEVYQSSVNINGNTVTVRAVLNPSGKLRTVFIVE